ncbi:MAG TPA: 3-oxoacyl-ACP reductase family protein [Chloroflexota bacterium]|jgi:glucose 1-dehydrogenase/3-oxoacyl-[acyl-carrier protein] reductase|nr:3-oxoacyl-ACP reductase family protein [Chloroflexota bacterium]
MDGTRPLAGKRALVTGAAIGIGRGIAAELARQGAQVALHYAYETEPGPQAAEEITVAGGRATAILADLAEVTACRRLVDEAAAFLGGLDILINNAGVTERGDFLEISPELYDRVFHINMRAQFFCAQAAVRHMLPAGGSIVNISSIHAFAGVPGYSIYAATKGAIVSFTRELAIELAPVGVRVNAIGPGHVEVERHLRNPNYSHEASSKMVPLGRVGTPADIARTAAFLASDAADFITGQMLYVDGGTTAKLSITPAPLQR